MSGAVGVINASRWWILLRRMAGRLKWSLIDRWRRATKRIEIWSIAIYEGASPFQLAPATVTNEPTLRAEDVTDAVALFVADPFMVHDGGRWVMFFEILNLESQRGEIAVASSTDGITWAYECIVLAEPFHLSYPYVFPWQGEWYMIPETSQAGAVRLYRAVEFPRRWELERHLLDRPCIDPSVIWHGGRWWLFAAAPPAEPGVLRLFHSAALDQPWQEHPLSPLVTGNRSISRPGGRIIQADGRLYRIAQDGLPRYGSHLHAFEITQLTPTEYEEQPAEGNPILTGATAGWNGAGMHHLDAHQLAGGRWFAAVDGHRMRWKLLHMRGLRKRVRAKHAAITSGRRPQ